MKDGIYFSLLLLNFLQISLGAPRLANYACQLAVDINSASSPIISNVNGIINAEGKGFIQLSKGEKFRAECPSNDVPQHFASFRENSLTMECISDSIVKTPYGMRNFTDFHCKSERFTGETVVRTGTCYNGYTEAEISFPSSNPPNTLLTVCHNEDLDETLYTKHYIFGDLLDEAESGGNRPSFREGDFYPNISTDNCYKQVTQIETVAILLGSQELADHYIQPGKNLFFSRGHLVPNGDPIYASEKDATFYFINASPQWQIINGGNWNQLEIKARTLAESRASTFTVWTGSYEVMTLNDTNGNEVEIWLGRDSQGKLVKKLPVNKYTWKVIFDESKNQAVAVIQINNPWISVKAEDILCPNICSQLPWVSWKIDNITLGYTFCCDVASFKDAVPYAPSFGDVTLLK